MTSSDVPIRTGLQTLDERWRAITERPEDPRSLMNVIEYGLGERRRGEVYVNRLLRYLCDPSEPHGMDTDFLTAFLEELPADCGFEEDTFDLSNVRVNDQVAVDDDELSSSTGYVDLVFDVPNEWFLMIELKFSAPETGTTFYCGCTEIGDRSVAEYESGQYYLYLHQGDRPPASGDCFANLMWAGFLEEILQPFIIERAARYPHRTVGQLYDLKDDIHGLTGMSDHHDRDAELVELYHEYYDAITDVSETFDAAWEAYATRWGETLATALEGPAIRAEFRPDDELCEVAIDRGEDHTERWLFRDTGGDWQHVFKHGWRKRERDLVDLEGRADDFNDFRIGFYHRMGENSNRELAVRDHTLKFNFRCMGSNPTAFRDIYNERFDDQKSAIQATLAETNAELTGQKRTMIEGTYEFDVGPSEDIFEAYTGALKAAFEELVVSNETLIELLSETFTESIDQYQAGGSGA